ncbi:hypothetical protein L5515_000210 [Caenorhabditis briggsae]|uniref:Zinc finger PHD-type domain-containing protein n=2 Tax=Caenorhabditis briggsae TaxID=6238 RepID=A0AAE9DZB3_CAEBR|nr:hypothetical protein L5515_000210 [Caenorhabditis briggsae]
MTSLLLLMLPIATPRYSYIPLLLLLIFFLSKSLVLMNLFLCSLFSFLGQKLLSFFKPEYSRRMLPREELEDLAEWLKSIGHYDGPPDRLITDFSFLKTSSEEAETSPHYPPLYTHFDQILDDQFRNPKLNFEYIMYRNQSKAAGEWWMARQRAMEKLKKEEAKRLANDIKANAFWEELERSQHPDRDVEADQTTQMDKDYDPEEDKPMKKKKVPVKKKTEPVKKESTKRGRPGRPGPSSKPREELPGPSTQDVKEEISKLSKRGRPGPSKELPEPSKKPKLEIEEPKENVELQQTPKSNKIRKIYKCPECHKTSGQGTCICNGCHEWVHLKCAKVRAHQWTIAFRCSGCSASSSDS